MMKVFNTTGVCIPEKHYMVDISERLAQIKTMVDAGKYFCINRARQYGKTTTLTGLRRVLKEEYDVASLDFQGIGEAGFQSEYDFVKSFCLLLNRRGNTDFHFPEGVGKRIEKIAGQETPRVGLGELFDLFIEWFDAAEKGVVLLIDEVDSASDRQPFLDFLAQLRLGYIERDSSGISAFQSVILAGVTDIRHLRSKIRDEDQHKVNSPWNIAADFDIDMSLSQAGIEEMLKEYEKDHNTGMDPALIAKELRDYTSGYPFLVSRLCQIMAEKLVPEVLPSLSDAWTKRGVEEAVKHILDENNTLFDSLSGKLKNYPKLKDVLRNLLMEGEQIPYHPDSDMQNEMMMYGFVVRNGGNTVVISNRIIESRLYNLFLAEEAIEGSSFNREGDYDRNIFIENGTLNMPLILERFIDTYTKVFGPLKDRFPEKDGRELFLLYLRPIINGTGNYYIEAQTRNQTRTDVVVDYLGQQYVVELKIWRGDRYNERGEQQLKDYLDYFGLDTGYLLSFNFNEKKEPGLKRVSVDGKTLYEAML